MSNDVQKKVEEESNNTTEQTIGKTENRKPEELVVAKNSSSTSLSKLSVEQLKQLDYTDFSTPARMLALAEVLVNSGMCPLKKPADVVVALMTGQELGLSAINSINEIYPINGKPTLGVHIMKAMALNNGILYTKTRDFEPYYMFVEADSEGKPKLIDKKTTDKQGVAKVEKVPVILSYGFLDEQPKGSLKKEVDKVTEYELVREIKTPSGKWITMKQKGSFSLSEAKQAGLDQKDNWLKYPKRMLEARAFSIAMREIADDVVKGIKTADEMSDGNIVVDAEVL